MANPLYGQNKADGLIDARGDNKYNFKLYGIPLAVNGEATQALLTGADDERFIHYHHSGLVVYGNYVGANTVDVPPGHTLGVEYSMTDTDDIGCQWTVGPYLAGGLEGYDIFTVGSTALPKPAFYFKVHLYLSDVSGTDDCHVGFRIQNDAVETTGVAYTDFCSLNVDAGTVKIEDRLNSDTATSVSSEGTMTDGSWAWVEVRVSSAGLVTYFQNGVQLTTNDPALTLDAGDIVTPWFYFRNAAHLSDCVIDEVEFGLQ